MSYICSKYPGIFILLLDSILSLVSHLTDKTKQTLLHAAADSNNLQAIQTLISINIAQNQINSVDEYNMTPMHLASIIFDKSCFELLLTLHPDFSIKDNDGNTVIDLLKENEDIDDSQKEKYIKIISK